jgi:thioredoxin reductase (NADPH)
MNRGKVKASKDKTTSSKDKPRKWFIPEESRKALLERFKELIDPVELKVFIKDGENDPYNTLAVIFCADLSKLSKKITTTVNVIGDKESKKYGVERTPTILFSPDKFKIRYTGAPIGEEGRSFIETIMMVSRNESGLSEDSKLALEELNEKRHVQVFVTPDCPYCPGQVVNAFRTVIERPDLVSAECIEAMENIDLARKVNIGAVPHTVINDQTISKGLEPEEMFINELITMEESPTLKQMMEGTPIDTGGIEIDLIILGGGPAGLTAGIYAQRAGLSSVILEKDMIGGQVALTPVVENYPGFTNIGGKKLMDIIATQAKNYVPIHEGEEVLEIKIGKKIEALTNRNRYLGNALIIASGAGYRKLGIPGEEKFDGHGVSYCATCDGYFFKDRKVALVGGGNTALTDALYLKNIGANVAIIHRRDSFRGEKYLQDSVKREKIPVIYDTIVKEIIGNKKKITGIKIENTKSKASKIHKVEGVFIAIGEVPNSKLAGEIGISLTKGGFIDVDRTMRTNIPRVYAAGDITGGVRQIVTAVSEGATAALSAFEDLMNPYWLRNAKD